MWMSCKDEKTHEVRARDHGVNQILKNQHQPTEPQDGQLTFESVSGISSGVIKKCPICLLFHLVQKRW